MARPALEVADILNAHGDAYVATHAGHLSRGQLKVMSAIRSCRTVVLGGHVSRCADCAHVEVAYNSCRNRHCPKCQGATARDWLAARQAELLPVPYYHLVFTLPAAIGTIAYQNKAAVYDLLFRASAETLTTIAADPRHLGARIGITAVLHTWGSALTHHPHIHAVVPGGGLSPDGTRWIDSKLCGCDLVALKVGDVPSGSGVRSRSVVIQHKTGQPVPFEITEPTKDALAAWLAIRRTKGGDWLWPSRSHIGGRVTTRQYGRLVDQWVSLIGLNPADYGTHSLRRTKVSILYKRTGNLRACQLLLGHTKLESTVRYLGIEVDDALSLSEQTEI